MSLIKQTQFNFYISSLETSHTVAYHVNVWMQNGDFVAEKLPIHAERRLSSRRAEAR